MLSHELERMMSAGMKIELLPSVEGVYEVNIIVGEKTFHGSSSFSLVQAIENAEQSVHSDAGDSGE